MNGWQREATHGQIEEITDYWNCDGSCTLASLLFGSLKNFRHLVLVAQCVHVSVAGLK
jgi:hypothetical protein